MTLNLIVIITSTIIISAFIMIAFITGLHYGSKVKNDEYIEKPSLNPVKVIQKSREHHAFQIEQKKEADAIETMFNNIEIYNGTEEGQKDIVKED